MSKPALPTLYCDHGRSRCDDTQRKRIPKAESDSIIHLYQFNQLRKPNLVIINLHLSAIGGSQRHEARDTRMGNSHDANGSV